MLVDALELDHYLPISYKNQAEEDYIAFLWDAFRTNYEHEKHQFALLAYHMLTMSFVYFNIWQIKVAAPDHFAMGLIGFSKDVEKSLMEATSPFVFSTVNERSVLRFLKLIECDNGKIGTYAKLVDDRNETTHSNGNIFFRTAQALDTKIDETLRVVKEIEEQSSATIQRCYAKFLAGSYDPEVREYADAEDQIREVLIHENYFSWRDLEICRRFDLGSLPASLHIDPVRGLHDSLCILYGE